MNNGADFQVHWGLAQFQYFEALGTSTYIHLQLEICRFFSEMVSEEMRGQNNPLKVTKRQYQKPEVTSLAQSLITLRVYNTNQVLKILLKLIE